MIFEIIAKDENVTLSCYILDRQPDPDCRPPRPAVIICPGGAYSFCSDREGEAVALRMAAAGFHAFVLRYTVAPPAPLWPRPLLDAAWAVDLVRGRATLWHIRPDALFLLGFSAGGHAAASLGVHWNSPEVLEKFESPRPDGLILCYPVITSDEKSHELSMENLTGGETGLLALAKLEDFAGAHTPPAFIWHTFADEAVPVENSLRFATALRAHGVPFELHIFPQGAHGYSLAVAETGRPDLPPDPHIASWLPLCLQWIELNAGSNGGGANENG